MIDILRQKRKRMNSSLYFYIWIIEFIFLFWILMWNKEEERIIRKVKKWDWHILVIIKKVFFVIKYIEKDSEEIQLWRIKDSRILNCKTEKQFNKVFDDSKWYHYLNFLLAYFWDFWSEYAPSSVLDWEFTDLMSIYEKTWEFKNSLLYNDIEFFIYKNPRIRLWTKNKTKNDTFLM